MELDGRKLLYAVVHDVTDRRRAEEELRVRSAALAAAPHGIVITGLDGCIEWVNPAFTEMTGYTLADVVGGTPGVIEFGLRDGSERLEAFLKAVADGNQARGGSQPA